MKRLTGFLLLSLAALPIVAVSAGAQEGDPPLPESKERIASEAALDGAPGYYVLDGFGGVHAGGGAPILTPTPYWGWDVAGDLELAPTGCYVLDRFGGVHAGGGAPILTPATPYWGWDVAGDLELASTGYYVLDRFGGVHAGAGAPALHPATPYWGFDIARDIELTPSDSVTTTTVTIDFETFPGPDGELGTDDDVTPPTGPEASPVLNLSNEYASVGVIFDRATLFYGPIWGAVPGFGSYYLSSIPVEARLTVPVYGIEITSYSHWNAKLTAFDASDRILAVANLWHPNPGGGFVLGTLHLSTNEPIARFTVIEQSDNGDLILNLDRLVLETQPCAKQGACADSSS